LDDTNEAHALAICKLSLVNTVRVILRGGVSATNAGDASWLPSNGSAGLIG
jgi:hypothetical protein